METQLHDKQVEAGAEQAPRLEPRIYVASLSDYNVGRLHGAWLEADQLPNDLQADIDHMLASSPEPGAEEWAIHDYENFGPVHLGEYMSVESVSRLANGLVKHGVAFGHWAEYVGLETEEVANFDFAYCGTWQSLQEWLEESAVDYEARHALEQLPEWLQPYVSVDYDALGRDIAMDAYVVEDGEGVHVFEVTA
jgi:antirestriction protein